MSEIAASSSSSCAATSSHRGSSTTTASQGGSSSGPLPSGAEVLTAWLKHAAYVRVDGRKYLVLESVPFDDLDTGLAYEELVPFFATQREVIGLVLVEVPEWEQQKLRAALAVDPITRHATVDEAIALITDPRSSEPVHVAAADVLPDTRQRLLDLKVEFLSRDEVRQRAAAAAAPPARDDEAALPPRKRMRACACGSTATLRIAADAAGTWEAIDGAQVGRGSAGRLPPFPALCGDDGGVDVAVCIDCGRIIGYDAAATRAVLARAIPPAENT